ncbi:MAG: HAD family hydrolase [Acidimicrobiia bacterium]
MRAAAFFDLDKTVIAKASMLAFGRTLYREGLISRSLLLRALYGQVVYMHLGASHEKLERMRESVLALTKGWEQPRVQRIVEETLEAVIEPIVYKEALDLIAAHLSAGQEVWLVSTSPEEIVAPLGRHLGVTGIIGTRAKLDAERRYTGEVEFYAYGPFKAEAMRGLAIERGIDLAESWAYSDSGTDIPMLEAVGNPVAVNPDRDLLRAARANDWTIRRFEQTVALRRGVPLAPAAGLVAAGGALTAAAVVWWKIRTREPEEAQASRSFRAAVSPRATRMASRMSFFMPGTLTRDSACHPRRPGRFSGGGVW